MGDGKNNKSVIIVVAALIVSAVLYIFFRKDIKEIIAVRKARKAAAAE